MARLLYYATKLLTVPLGDVRVTEISLRLNEQLNHRLVLEDLFVYSSVV